MQAIQKCLLLPIDGTNESLRPAAFVRRLYSPLEIKLILCYFSPAPPPAFTSAVAESPALMAKRREYLRKRRQDVRRIFDHAEEFLLKEGFSKESILEHVADKEISIAKQTCILAGIRKADALLVQNQVRSNLEDFLIRSAPASAFLQYCLECPVWFTEGEIIPKNAVICIVNDDSSLRIADHAGHMLSGTGVNITLLHATRKLSQPVSCRPSDAGRELAGYADNVSRQGTVSYLLRASEILSEYGIGESSIQITLIPGKKDTASEILSWCESHRVGIAGLGRNPPEGIWGFLRTSVARKIVSDSRNMAIWVA